MEFKQTGATTWQQIENKQSTEWFLTTLAGERIDVTNPALVQFPETGAEDQKLWYLNDLMPVKNGKPPPPNGQEIAPGVFSVQLVYSFVPKPQQKTYYFDWFESKWMEVYGFTQFVFYDLTFKLQQRQISKLQATVDALKKTKFLVWNDGAAK